MLDAAIKTLSDLLRAVMAYFSGYVAGKTQAAKESAQGTITAVKDANDAAAVLRDKPVPDKLRWLKERGLLRDIPADSGKPK
jgi:hypothetical protein